MIAIIAWRGGVATKSRLSSILSDRQRNRVGFAMLQGVVTAARQAAGISAVWIVAPTRPPVIADKWICDLGTGLNRAFAFALGQAEGPVVLLPADLPIVTAQDLDALCAACSDCDVVIAPDDLGVGTNALVMRRPGLVSPNFGPNSFRVHNDAAMRRGLSVEAFHAAHLAFDLDRPDQLPRLGSRYLEMTGAF